MNEYTYNARDVAAYFKWFSVPNYLEVSYMQYIFNLGDTVLAKPLTTDFEKFKTEVFRELYYLWANGFEDEKSDVSLMPAVGSIALICDQECISLESYMKLIKLHLIFSKFLPYVKINFAGLPLSLGLRCDYEVYEANVVKIVEGLNLVCMDFTDRVFDLHMGVPDELLLISLNSEFKERIFGSTDIRTHLRNSEMTQMEELKKQSLELENISKKDSKSSKGKSTDSANQDKKTGKDSNVGRSNVDSRCQPKGKSPSDKGPRRG
ncbi:MAG: hypothetical protein WC886_00850 [Saccharofermentanaceae bacterium]|nr:hypothetical protein [Clostridia bacterium]NLX67902.1 hypothetical protein [Clostridiaceae bacterium]HOO48474.1 hypothetical protein [Saccharofermentans sp.]HPG64252.1 hypothetical protein [Saccharofermentans sp.]HPJ81814.1 hypothetical protein [Saccharofermentans sp.]